MKNFKTYIIESQEEQNVMFLLKNYNNTVLDKMDINVEYIKNDIIDFLNIVLKNLKIILSGDILLSIIRSNLDNSDNIIEIVVKNQDKKIEIILNSELFDKIVSNQNTEKIENVIIAQRNYNNIYSIIHSLINFLKNK